MTAMPALPLKTGSPHAPKSKNKMTETVPYKGPSKAPERSAIKSCKVTGTPPGRGMFTKNAAEISAVKSAVITIFLLMS